MTRAPTPEAGQIYAWSGEPMAQGSLVWMAVEILSGTVVWSLSERDLWIQSETMFWTLCVRRLLSEKML